MRQKIETRYRHKVGPIVICQGIGCEKRGPWGAYAVKPNGSLKRLTSIPTQPTPEGVQLCLDLYKGKTIWPETLA